MEIELWRLLRDRGVDAELIEPPNIAATFPAGRLVIACKHLYSEANIEKVLSGAVHQIERSDSPGIVSFCPDADPQDLELVRSLTDAMIRKEP